MKNKEKIIYSGKDEKLDSIGIPINPNNAKLGSSKLTENPKFPVFIFVLTCFIIAIIIFLVANYWK